MIAIVCSVCGEPASAEEDHCAVCSAADQRAVPEEKVRSNPEARLLDGVERTLVLLDDIRIGRAREMAQEARAQRERALRMRLESQGGVLEARLRSSRGAAPQPEMKRALQRIRHELYSPSP